MLRKIYYLGLIASLTGCQSSFYGNNVGFSAQVKLRQVNSQITTNGISSDVDILFVVDNSQSAAQDAIGRGFDDFIDALSTPSWRIAITTTDAKLSEIDGEVPKEGQDGKLVQFRASGAETGPTYLDIATVGYADRFKSTILLTAEDSNGKRYVPVAQGYQQGIFTSYRSFERAENASVFRNNANLAVILVSDEDELGNGLDGSPPYTFRNVPQDATINNDYVDYLATRFPGKNVNVHSIIVPPGDTQCKDSALGVQFGETYAFLSGITGGLVRSICTKVNGQLDFTSHLRDIGLAISKNTQSLELECEPYNGAISIQFSPAAHTVGYRLVGNRVYFSPGVPPSTSLNLNYSCIQAL